ncbi:MAG: DUF1947 domain-containing protein [Candidatus Geothermarchaeota archaeon]
MNKLLIEQLSKKEFKQIVLELGRKGLSLHITKPKDVRLVKANEKKIVFIDKVPVLIWINNMYLPFVMAADNFVGLKKVYVNKGAIKPILNGANIMRPGLTKWDSFTEGEIVAVYSEDYNTPIAIGISVMSSNLLNEMKRGKVIDNIHYIGDAYWKIATSVRL